MNVFTNSEIQERVELESVKENTALSYAERISIFTNTRMSFAHKAQSSLTTIFTITNSMIGTSILIMPLNFIDAGIFTSLIALIVVGFFSFKTSTLLLVYNKRSDYDLPEQVQRVLGKKMKIVYIISSSILLVGVGLTYFLLMSNVLYSGIKAAFPSLPDKDNGIIFDRFSYQYTGIILGVVCLPLFAMRDLKFILKITSLGVYALFFFVGFCIYIGIDAIARGQVKFGNSNGGIKWYTFDFITICAVFGLSFEIQHGLLPMVKYNKNQQHNKRDVGLGYIIGSIIYFIVGFFGALGVNWRSQCGAGHNPETIMDCITDDNKFTQIFAITSEAFIFLHLITIQPIICYITRTQLLNLIYGEVTKAPAWTGHLFNFSFLAFMVGLQILDVHPTTIVSIVGSVGGYVLIYLAPIAMYFKFRGDLNPYRGHATSVADGKSYINDPLMENHQAGGSELESGAGFGRKSVRPSITRRKRLQSYLEMLFYGFVLIYGTAVMLLVIGDLIYNLIKK